MTEIKWREVPFEIMLKCDGDIKCKWDSLLTALQEETKQCKKAIMLLVQVTDTLSTGRTPDRAGAALKQIFKWLNENHPVGQEGEGNQ